MSLIKLATDFYTKHYQAQYAYDNMMNTHLNKTTGPYGKGTLIGGGIGALIGTGLGLATRNPGQAIGGAVLGGLGGSLVGLGIAGGIHNMNAHESAEKHDKGYSGKIHQLKSMNNYHYGRINSEEHSKEQVRSLYRD